MKSKYIILLATGLAGAAFGQGSLTPPGAPAPTMKTLNQIEPRTPISSVPYTISEPGSYYLTTNLTSTGNGVVITTNGVTLDLMGFTLSGDGDSSDFGVFVDSATNHVVKAVVVRNGSVENFELGILAACSRGGRFEQLALLGNTFCGIYLDGESGQCDGNTIADCSISGNGDYGVYLTGQYSQCNGNTIADCTINGNSGQGVYLDGFDGQCDDNTFTDCTISGNGDSGIYLDGEESGQCNGNTVADCTISGNSSLGIEIIGRNGQCDDNTFTDCTISGNGSDDDDDGIYLDGESGQCDGNTIADCSIIGNAYFGIYLYGESGRCDGNTVADCSISGNSSLGVYLYGFSGQCDGNTISDCTISGNGICGIGLDHVNGNRVEGNHVTRQTGTNTTYGILCSRTTNNLIIRNSCVGQTNNFQFNSNDTYGSEISATGMITNMNPWANFSR